MIEIVSLRQIPLFSDLVDEQFEFVAMGRERWLAEGEVLAVEGEPSGTFWVLLEGEIQCTKQMGDRQVPWTNFVPPAYFGHELILLNKPYLATARAMLSSRVLEFGREGFWKMMELCPAITRELLVVTAQRTQDLSALSMQSQKFIALGSLTSGLSQELQQVARSGRQAVENLQALFQWMQPLTTKLNAQTMSGEQQQFLLTLQQDVLKRMTTLPQDSHPTAWQRQRQAVTDWLAAHAIPHADEFAETLTQAGLDVTTLEGIAAALPEPSLCAVLAWLKATLRGMQLANTVDVSTQRIAQLVQAAKDYTYLDQAPLQEMDIHEGIENTLIMLNHSLEASITVVREYDRTLPPICVYGSDLNQAWTHLISNAIEAMDGTGQLTIRTRREGERVLVEIIDTGTGIPSEIQPYVFDQFFTTKGVEKGTGIGLAIAHQVVVTQHQGKIRLRSQPGETCFQVYLPMDLTENRDRLSSSWVA